MTLVLDYSVEEIYDQAIAAFCQNHEASDGIATPVSKLEIRVKPRAVPHTRPACNMAPWAELWATLSRRLCTHKLIQICHD